MFQISFTNVHICTLPQRAWLVQLVERLDDQGGFSALYLDHTASCPLGVGGLYREVKVSVA